MRSAYADLVVVEGNPDWFEMFVDIQAWVPIVNTGDRSVVLLLTDTTGTTALGAGESTLVAGDFYATIEAVTTRPDLCEPYAFELLCPEDTVGEPNDDPAHASSVWGPSHHVWPGSPDFYRKELEAGEAAVLRVAGVDGPLEATVWRDDVPGPTQTVHEEGVVLLLDNSQGDHASTFLLELTSTGCASYCLSSGTPTCMDHHEPSVGEAPVPATVPITGSTHHHDIDAYRIEVPAGFYGDIEVSTAITLWLSDPVTREPVPNPVAAEVDRQIDVLVRGVDPSCAPYVISTGAPGCVDDASEPNDTFLQAWALQSLDVQRGRIVTHASPDFWSFVVPGGESRRFSVSFDNDQGDVDPFLFDDAGNGLDASQGIGDVEVLTVQNTTPGDRTYLVEVALYANAQGNCVPYTLSLGDCWDAMEPNDTRSMATPLGSQDVSGFVGADSDWFLLQIPPYGIAWIDDDVPSGALIGF
ncbi:MAG: PPC domain-containing protein, partial [Myxococcales bacterium]|nr:PPC domain-containing protein [Myxococcales bacterium]